MFFLIRRMIKFIWPITATMKSTLLVTALLLSLSSLNAQKIRLNYGLAAGMSMANLTTQQLVDLVPKPGFAAYVFVDVPVFHQFSLQNELGYYNLGAITNNEKTGVNWKNYTTSIRYLALSFLPKFTVKNTGLSFLAGYSFGYKVSSGKTGGGPINYGEAGIGSLYAPEIKRFDIFGVVGMEYYLKAGPGLSVRYMEGLTNIYDAKVGYGGLAQNHAFVFTLTYRIFSR